MKALLLVLGIAALVAGLLFAGQGMGWISWPRTSFMIGASEWITYGLIIAALGIMMIGVGSRRRR